MVSFEILAICIWGFPNEESTFYINTFTSGISMTAVIGNDVRKMSKYCFMAIGNMSALDTPLFLYLIRIKFR